MAHEGGPNDLDQIKSAVDAGKSVHWSNEGYVVHKDVLGQYLITFLPNGDSIGLCNRAGTELNGDEAAFFVSCPDLDRLDHSNARGINGILRE
ncbi:hypothetical protein [Roseobacter weihaiensis]|uniref:hypothetical protein n=1 Tax=Roseobacter weihaiensis TaxID=2763262 RepID=UPI001D0ADC22|nr:hypothetical protein [Roseobacter sp. H9]